MEPRIFYLAAAILGALFLYWVLSMLVFVQVRFVGYHRRRQLAYPALGWAGWAAFYLRTVASALRLWWWWRAFLADGLRIPPGATAEPAVLYVHGFHMNGTSMWGIRRALERRGRATQAVSLGLPYRSAEVYARSLVRAMGRLLAAAPGGKIDVVAHSMGGLVLRLAPGATRNRAASPARRRMRRDSARQSRPPAEPGGTRPPSV